MGADDPEAQRRRREGAENAIVQGLFDPGYGRSCTARATDIAPKFQIAVAPQRQAEQRLDRTVETDPDGSWTVVARVQPR